MNDERPVPVKTILVTIGLVVATGVALYLVVLLAHIWTLLLVALFNLFQTSSTRGPQSTLAFSDFLNDVNRGQVTDVTIQGNAIAADTSGNAYVTGVVNVTNEPGGSTFPVTSGAFQPVRSRAPRSPRSSSHTSPPSPARRSSVV